MAHSTALVRGEIDTAARRLRALVTPDTVHALTTMHDYRPDPATLSFDAARWLEDVLADRRRALAEQVAQLQEVLGTIADRLDHVSTALSTVDSAAAAALGAARPARS